MKTSVLLLFLFLLAGSPCADAQSLEEPLKVNLDEGSAEQVSPFMSVGSDGTIYLAWVDLRENRNGDIYLRRSDDGGLTFSEEMVVYQGGRVPAGRGRSGDMVVDPEGRVHIVWVESVEGQSTDIRYARSIDRGATFSGPVSVVGSELAAIEDFPSIAVDSTGLLHIAWIDGRELKEGSSDYDQIWAIRSLDGGETFETPRRASFVADGGGGSCECCNTAIEVTPGGDLLIAFRSNVNNLRDIYVARSTDRGESFEEGIPIATEPVTLFACPVAGPDLAIDRFGTAHIMWQDRRQSDDNKGYLYYTILAEGSRAVARDRPVTIDATRTNYPSIALTSEGGLFATFDSYTALSYRGEYLSSGNGGGTFENYDSFVPDATASNQQVPALEAGPDGTRYLFWQDDRSGNSDLYFARDTRPIAIIKPLGVSLSSPETGETIARDGLFTWEAPSNLLVTDRVVYVITLTSTTGTVYTGMAVGTTSWSPTDIPEGEYRWSVVARTSTGESLPSGERVVKIGPTTSVEEEIVPAPHLLDLTLHQ